MNPRKVLIVEDEGVVRMHLSRIVAGIGHEVTAAATTAHEALEAAEVGRPDLVLMDIHLAGGSDGVETARLLVERHGCSVVFVTANADVETVERTAPIGAAGYVVKPFTAAEVRAAVATALGGHDRKLRARERERSLASALVSRGEAIFVTDERARVTFANPMAADLTGAKAQDAVERDLFDVLRFVAESDAEAVRAALRRSLLERRGESFSRLEIVGRDGVEHAVGLEVEPTLEGEQATGLLVLLRALDHGAALGGRDLRVPAPPRRVEAPFGAGTRLLVYSHDTFGLGHLRRSLNLIRALVARHPELSTLLVTGSPMVHRFEMPAGTDYLKLPAVRKVAPEQYEARSLSISGRGIRTLRSNLLLRTIRDYEPNVVLVDHSPVGMNGEILPALEWLREQGTCTRILGLRDIVDDPETVRRHWREQGIWDVLRELYDHVVVYGARPVFDTVERYGFPAEIAAKTRFVHYVSDAGAAATEEDGADGPRRDGRPLVAVTIGGGDGGAEEVIGTFLAMLARFRDRIDFDTEILTGPFVAPELLGRFRAAAAGLPVVLRDFVPSAPALFRRADLVVSTSGYNTVAELLAHARRAILVPRCLHRDEQLIRARRMAELGLAVCLHPREITPESLFDAIRAARADEPLTRARADGTVPTDGAQRFASFCSELTVVARLPEPQVTSP